jgi:hypothetical protein
MPSHAGSGGFLHVWEEIAEAAHGAEWAYHIGSVITPSLVAWVIGASHSLGEALKLTLPLTLAIAVIVASVRAKGLNSMQHPLYGYLGLTTVVLAVAALLSQLLQVGRSPDWVATLGEAWKASPGFMFILSGPLALLQAYFVLYQAGPFLLSVAAGSFMGWRLSSGAIKTEEKAKAAGTNPNA